MKFVPIFVGICSLTHSVYGQGTFIYDQQSSTDETPWPNGAGPILQQLAVPDGQSFTPSFAAIDFIRIKTADSMPSNGLGATLAVVLRANSISGTIVGTTGPVFLSDGFTGVADFLFPASISITPHAVYYFQPVVQSGDPWNITVGEFLYPGGTAFYQGLPLSGGDYWFREGIVPEPSAGLLALGGAGLFLLLHRRARRG